VQAAVGGNFYVVRKASPVLLASRINFDLELEDAGGAVVFNSR
jgi:hypothetical protein